MFKILAIETLIFLIYFILLISNNVALIGVLVVLFYLLTRISWNHAIGFTFILYFFFPGLLSVKVIGSEFAGYRILFSILMVLWFVDYFFINKGHIQKIFLYPLIITAAFGFSQFGLLNFSGVRQVILYWPFAFCLFFVFSTKGQGIKNLEIISKYVVVGFLFLFVAGFYEFSTGGKIYEKIPYLYDKYSAIFLQTNPYFIVQQRLNMGRATVFAQHSSSFSSIVSIMLLLLLLIYDLSFKRIYLIGIVLGIGAIFFAQAKTGILTLLIIMVSRFVLYGKKVSFLLRCFIPLLFMYILISLFMPGIAKVIDAGIISTVFPYFEYEDAQAYNTIGRIQSFMGFFEWSKINSLFGIVQESSKSTEWSAWGDANKFVYFLYVFGLWGLMCWVIFWSVFSVKFLLDIFSRHRTIRIFSLYAFLLTTAIMIGYFATYFFEPDFLLGLPLGVYYLGKKWCGTEKILPSKPVPK